MVILLQIGAILPNKITPNYRKRNRGKSKLPNNRKGKNYFFSKKVPVLFGGYQIKLYLCTRNSGCSSARLEYASGGRVVAGSNPVTPTGKSVEQESLFNAFLWFVSFQSEACGFLVSGSPFVLPISSQPAAASLIVEIRLLERRFLIPRSFFPIPKSSFPPNFSHPPASRHPKNGYLCKQ